MKTGRLNLSWILFELPGKTPHLGAHSISVRSQASSLGPFCHRFQTPCFLSSLFFSDILFFFVCLSSFGLIHLCLCRGFMPNYDALFYCHLVKFIFPLITFSSPALHLRFLFASSIFAPVTVLYPIIMFYFTVIHLQLLKVHSPPCHISSSFRRTPQPPLFPKKYVGAVRCGGVSPRATMAPSVMPRPLPGELL